MFVDGCSQEMHSYCTGVIPLSNRLALGIGNKDIQRNTQEPMQQNNKENEWPLRAVRPQAIPLPKKNIC